MNKELEEEIRKAFKISVYIKGKTIAIPDEQSLRAERSLPDDFGLEFVKKRYFYLGGRKVERWIVYACILMLILGMTITVYAMFKTRMDFFDNLFDRDLKIQELDPDAAIEIKKIYRFADIPEGFSILYEEGRTFIDEERTVSLTTYANGEKEIEILQFLQHGELSVDNEEADNIWDQVDGNDAHYTSKYGEAELSFYMNGYGFTINATYDLTKEEMLILAESLVEGEELK